jgi:Protein of unknown function (DUF3325).
MSALTGLMAFAGMAALALRMAPHRRAALEPHVQRRCSRLSMTIGGLVLLSGAFALAVRAYGWSMGALVWFSSWSVGGLAVTLLLTYRPRWLPGLSIASVVGAAVWMLLVLS